MNKLLTLLSILTFSALAQASTFPILLCDADEASANNGAKTQFLIDMNTHSVYMLIDGKAPSVQRVVTIE
ncbi:MAG: hypothetical protein MJK18_11005, partial [Bdellovibrionales bacterium]|nr:hypothetical protein [Bdellovibrionales bacterium]